MKEIREEGPQGGTVTLHRVRWGGAGFDQWRDVTSLADASSSEKRTNCRDEARSKGTSEPDCFGERRQGPDRVGTKGRFCKAR